ncbi:hypothetical protein [Ureibacillus acetophenoni]|uniref:Uncharacterized protein n=1 Tax=Ureibacillus acetophenoni TaxID=614649 RepID=A0A285UUM2_9BACL|nr:hypothetical protein [Ureibacillus acetophenoni]SOC45068.1 hypothetical protein SAMN05877842_1303 [Ureibacillus acetophenoni]
MKKEFTMKIVLWTLQEVVELGNKRERTMAMNILRNTYGHTPTSLASAAGKKMKSFRSLQQQ